jgi:hypothetical protein
MKMPVHIDELDVAHARRPGEEIKRINVDFPAWMVAALDREARRLGGNTPIHYQDVASRTFAEGIRNPLFRMPDNAKDGHLAGVQL